MKNTHFVNCCGLDVDGHLTTALDIAIMSRELTTKHPEIFQYSTIWMDEFTHKTAKGESVFGLSNTNKLIRNYEGCNGLKTGSTGKAKFCLSCGEKVVTPISDNMIVCPECGKTVTKGKFCIECGHKFITACPKCGKEIVAGAKFCLECGEKL